MQITFSQEELNNLTKDLTLSKDKTADLVLELMNKYLLQKDNLVCNYHKQNPDLVTFFKTDAPVSCCNNIEGFLRNFTGLCSISVALANGLFNQKFKGSSVMKC